MRFKAVPHTADLAIEATGDSLEELFNSFAQGLGFLIAGEADANPIAFHSFGVDAMDMESLLVRFLNRLVYLFDTTGFVPSSAALAIDGLKLGADVYGFHLNRPARHCVKAATYHGLEIVREDGVFRATVIFDD